MLCWMPMKLRKMNFAWKWQRPPGPIFNELYWSEGDQAGFSYPQAGLRIHIYNADLLASALLARLSRITGDNNYKEPALIVARYAAKHQNEDGSWFYGETPGSRWIDNFHTGYNLMALREISKYANTDEFMPTIIKGLRYYKSNFSTPTGHQNIITINPIRLTYTP